MIYIFVLILSFLMILATIKWSARFGLIDEPNERSMHTISKPKLGGVAFTVSTLVGLLIFDFAHLQEYALVYSAIVVVLAGGIIDDVYHARPRLKLAFIFMAFVLCYLDGIYITTLGTFFGVDFELPGIAIVLLTYIAIAGYTNALNLIDGLDGLAASVSLIILATFLAIGIEHGDSLVITLTTLYIANLVAFLYFNWNPARIFMGDSGSLVLGFVISIVIIRLTEHCPPVSLLLIAALPVADMSIVVLRRWQRGQALMQADNNHIHHFLLSTKGSVRYSVSLIVLIQLLLSIIGYQLRDSGGLLVLVTLLVSLTLFFLAFDQRIKRRELSEKMSSKKFVKALLKLRT